MHIAAADAVELESLSVTGKTSQPVVRLKRSPIMSTVIGQAEIDKVKFTNTAELLNRIPGVSKSRNLRVPNGGKGYTIPLIDGFSVRDPYRGAVGQIEDTNPSDIERIEVIYGPGSALYGSNAFGGVINVITKEPPKEQESRIWVEGGDFDRTRAGITTAGTVASTPVGDVGYFLDTSYWNIGDYRDEGFDDRKMVSGKLVFNPTISSKLWVRGEHLDRNNRSAGSLTQAQYDADDKQSPGVGSSDDGETNSASIGYSMDTEQGELRIGYAIRHDEGHSITSFGGESDYEYLDMDFKGQYRHDFQGVGAGVLGTSGVPVSLTTGIELVDGRNQVQRAASGRISARDQDIDKFVYAPFAQLEVMATDRLKATLGLRYENVTYDAKDRLDSGKSNERVFKKYTPKFGITYDLSEDHMMFAGVSKGFAPPSRNQIFTDTYSNPDLDPEVATNYELGFRGAFVEQNISYDVGLYYLNVDDYISNEFVETIRGRDQFRPVNAAKVNFRGLEAQLEYEPIEYFRLGVSYTYARNKFVDFIDKKGGADEKDLSGNYLSSSPKHHINTRLTFIPMMDLEIELEMDSYSSSYTNSDNDLDPQGRFDQDDIFNLRVNYETGPVELWVTALNITDEKYATRVSYRTRRSYSVGNGRSIYAGIAYNF
jgi:outer membrane receptor protein involved in Fe transport